VTVLADDEMRQTHPLEKFSAFVLAVQHRDRRDGAGDQAMFCGDGDAGRAGSEALPRSRVEKMGIANPLDDHEAFVVAACCEPAAIQGDARDRLLRVPWIADSDEPARSVRVGSDDREISAEVDHAGAYAQRAGELGDTIRSVFLHEAAEVELHSRGGQDEPGAIPLDL